MNLQSTLKCQDRCSRMFAKNADNFIVHARRCGLHVCAQRRCEYNDSFSYHHPLLGGEGQIPRVPNGRNSRRRFDAMLPTSSRGCPRPPPRCCRHLEGGAHLQHPATTATFERHTRHSISRRSSHHHTKNRTQHCHALLRHLWLARMISINDADACVGSRKKLRSLQRHHHNNAQAATATERPLP